MPSDGLDVSLETKEVEKLISILLHRVENPGVLMKTLQRWIKAQTMKMFRGRRPDTTVIRGVKWPKLAKSTLKQKKNAVSKGKAIVAARPMILTGTTRDSLKILKTAKRGFLFGTRVKSNKGFPYPGHHNSNKFPFIFLNKNDFAQMTRATVDYLNGKIKNFKHYTTH